MRWSIPVVVVSVVVVLGAPARAAEFGLEQRIAAQRAIEQVYWSHRIWPRDNPGPKPLLSDVLPDAAIRAKVDDALRQSDALGAVWGRPIRPDQLQAELNRMIAQTHDGTTLRELFEALGNDPGRIAESLARPILAGRLIRDWYAFDARFHGELRAHAEAAAAACHDVSCLSRLGGEYRETVWRLEDSAEAWTAELDRLARAVGGAPDHLRVLQPGPLEESADAYTITAVLSQNEHEVKVATTTWAKRPFDAWWAQMRESFPPAVPQIAVGFAITAPQSTLCTDDTWTAIPPEIPEPRSGHTSVWTGSEMIVWGGSSSTPFENSGGRYVPATDSWTFTSTLAAPAPRNSHTAIWTGTRMIVWGGNAAGVTGTGGLYDPGTDSWTATSTGANAPSARTSHTAVWTGTEMIVWGGNSGSATLNTGARYNPGTDTWTPTSTGTNTPVARDSHSAVWTGTQMIVWGGLSGTFQNTGGRYTPGTNSWTATSTGANVPSGRIQHTALWTGSVMIVWGGQPGPVNTGGQYNPTSNTWTATSTGANVPSAREQHSAVWTQTEMIVWGGFASSPVAYLNTGGRYNPTTNAWTATSTGTNTPAGRYVHTAVWTGSEMIVWGGATPALSYTGGRYSPSTNSWVPTSTGSSLPTARFNHTGVWTGAEMIVWGGRGDGPALDTGGSYDPATASWTSIAAAGAPTGRQNHTAVWTGTKMIVWGGANTDYSSFFSTGGLYDPASNAWTPTSVGSNVPSARYYHTAVWAGTEMIVWGGQASTSFNTGGRYAPASDSWTPTSTGANVPSARALQTATWTGSAMVIWGGNVFENTGGRYFPATDSWLPTSTGANVPTIGTEFSTSVWTGSRVIIWGGYDFGAVNKGALYDPVGDAWTPTSTGANCPGARYGHNAVWTGRQMIIWGGSNDTTGGRYDPVANTWTATSTGAGVPGRRQNAASVWSGTEMIVWGGAPTTATGGRYCACASAAAPAGEADLSLGQPTPGTAHLSWTYAGSDASAFDVVRGDLSTLRSSGGDFSVATGSCLGNDVGAFVDDSSVPAPGSGFWYLVRAVNCGGRGGYGSAPRDTGITASGNDCN